MAHQSQQADDPGGPRDADTAPRPDVPLSWIDLLVAALAGFVSFGVYVYTLAPGLLRARSGEFQTLAAAPGYAHPCGSPVYVLLTRLAALIPAGEVAYRVNLLSAITGAVAVGLVYLLARSLVGRRWVSVAGAAALAVSPTFWSQAIVAELYTSAIAFMAAILLALSAWHKTGRSRWLLAAACLAAVSLGVHASVLLMVPAALALVILTRRRWLANWAAAILGTALGLGALLAAFWAIDRADSPTCYFRTVIVPSRSVWGLEPEDLDDFHDRVRLSLFPPQYQERLFSKPPGVTRQKAIDYLQNLPREFPPCWLAAAVGGLVWLGRKCWKMTLLLGLTWAAHLLFDLCYDTPHVHLLYIATYVPVAVLGVAGLALVADAWIALSRRSGRRGRSPAAVDAILGILGTAVVISPMLFVAAWNDKGRRDGWVPPEGEPLHVEYSAAFHGQVRHLVSDLEDDAVLFTGWSELYPCYYVAHLEQGRTRMVFLQDYPHPYYFELADSALAYVERVAPARPVYFTHVVGKVDRRFELKPVHRGRQTLYRVGKPIRKAGGQR